MNNINNIGVQRSVKAFYLNVSFSLQRNILKYQICKANSELEISPHIDAVMVLNNGFRWLLICLLGWSPPPTTVFTLCDVNIRHLPCGTHFTDGVSLSLKRITMCIIFRLSRGSSQTSCMDGDGGLPLWSRLKYLNYLIALVWHLGRHSCCPRRSLFPSAPSWDWCLWFWVTWESTMRESTKWTFELRLFCHTQGWCSHTYKVSYFI